MSDRNQSQSFRPRETARYAELSDLLGDIEVDLPVAEQQPELDLGAGDSLESALATVDASFPARPREVLISNPPIERDWNTTPVSYSRATAVAAPLAPKTLDAWDLRPSMDAQAEPDAKIYSSERFVDIPVRAPEMVFEPLRVEADILSSTGLQSDELEAADYEADELDADELGAADEDAFLSALDGLEGDILSDTELSGFAQPEIAVPVAAVEDVETAIEAAPDVQLAQAFNPVTDFEAPLGDAADFNDAYFDDAVFADIAEPVLAADANSSNDISAHAEPSKIHNLDSDFPEPEFEALDIDDFNVAASTAEVSALNEPVPTVPALEESALDESAFQDVEFENVDFGAAEDAVQTEPAGGAALSPVIAATAVAGGGLAGILGAMRANASRETHAVAGELPVKVLPAATMQGANRDAPSPVSMFPDIAAPYDDVPVTGSLKVPDFVAVEPKVAQRAPDFDEFEMDDFQPQRTEVVPPVAARVEAARLPEVIVHERAPNQLASGNHDQIAEDNLADLDFGNVFDDDLDRQNLSPTDELADLVGSNVEIDPIAPIAKDEGFAPMPAIPPMVAQRPGRGKWMAFGALGLALFGAVAVYGMSGETIDADAEPVIVRADNEPVRVAPDNPGGTVVPNQDRVVFNEVGGSAAVPEQPQETLVDGRQEPAIAGAPIKEEDRVVDGDTTAEPDLENGTAIAPRAVQTVTVRPDGTLVAAPQVAQAEAAPQADIVPETRPETAAAQPMPEIVPDDNAALAEIAAAPVVETPVAPTPVAETAAAETPVVEAPAAEAVAAAESANETVAAKVPVRVVETKQVAQKPKAKAAAETAGTAAKALDVVPSRPAEQPVNIVNAEQPAEQPAEQQTASAEPVAAEPVAAIAAGSYAIQIASQPTEEAATQSLRSLSGKFGSVLGGKDYAIQRAEIPGKGTFYRVRIIAGSKEDAGKLCARYKSAGGSCFVTR